MADSPDDGRGTGFDLRTAHPTERAVGIDFYISDVDGVGGRLRRSPGDFRVREIERIEPEPVDADPGAYGHVVARVTLRSWDTNDFAGTLSDRLGISRKRIRWAGTKDKRAVTTQLFSIEGVDPAAVPGTEASGGDDGPHPIDEAEIDVLGRLGRSIELGDLVGNEFEVTVADPERPENVEPITDALAAFASGARIPVDLEDASDGDDSVSVGVPPSGARRGSTDERSESVGVPNYFGQQRFGSRRPITHEVGLAIVRREWREAVRIYVADAYESEPESTQTARAAAGDCFDDEDWTGALDAMPNRLGYERTLLHALERQESGDGESGGVGDEPEFRAALGDLPENLQRMFVHATQSFAFNRICSERLDAGLPFHEPVAGDVVCFADADAPAGLALPDTDRLQRVTADRVDTIARHCERGRAFVTAPLVGTDTELGDGEPGEIDRRVLDELDLAPADFDLPDPFGSTGTRRAILVGTDLSVCGEAEPTFEFALPKGSYATVLLREYLKVDPVALG